MNHDHLRPSAARDEQIVAITDTAFELGEDAGYFRALKDVSDILSERGSIDQRTISALGAARLVEDSEVQG